LCSAAGSTNLERIRVLIVDDQAMVRSGLRYFLLAFDDLALVGEACSTEHALAWCECVRPDVVLMDLLVPGMRAADAIRAIRLRWPKTQVIALTGFWAEELVQDALDAGAAGHLLKNVSAEELATAIRGAYYSRKAAS
jgi:two-component system, NarL family, response regulator LiaR